MSKNALKYIAVLLLAVISTYYGHVLAEGLSCGSLGASDRLVFVAQDSENDCQGGHSRNHGMSCEQRLCNGFTCVMLGTDAMLIDYTHSQSALFTDIASDNFNSRTIEPPLNPPRIFCTI